MSVSCVCFVTKLPSSRRSGLTGELTERKWRGALVTRMKTSNSARASRSGFAGFAGSRSMTLVVRVGDSKKVAWLDGSSDGSRVCE